MKNDTHNENKQYAFKNQRVLLAVANTEAGKFLLSSLTDRKRIDTPIVKVTPNSYREFLGEDKRGKVFQEHFFTHDAVLEKLIFPLEKLRISNLTDQDKKLTQLIAHFAGLERQKNLPEIYLASTFNSNSGGDGYIRYHGGDPQTWSDRRTASTGADIDAASSPDYMCQAVFSDRMYLYRGFLPFDTSSLDDAAVVNATGTKLRLFITGATDSQTESVGVAITTQNDPTSLVLADFGRVTVNSPTELVTRLNISAITTSAYNEWLANSNMVSAISKTGYTKLGTRISGDIDNVAPGSGQTNEIRGNYANSASNKPELVVTLVASTGFFNYF